MKSYLPDTNIFLRFILDDVPSQTEKARKLFVKSKAKKIKIIVCQIVIFEIYFALLKYYEFSKSVVIRKISEIISTDYFEIENRKTFSFALKIHKKENISFVDAFLLAESKKDNLILETFDKKLSRLSKKK